MTLKELEELYWIQLEIAEDERELERDTTDKSRVIRERIEKNQAEYRRLKAYIEQIPDRLTRHIFRLRFEENLSWIQVAARIGGGNTYESVKKICYRYLRRR